MIGKLISTAKGKQKMCTFHSINFDLSFFIAVSDAHYAKEYCGFECTTLPENVFFKSFLQARKYRNVYFLAFVSFVIFVNLVFYQIALICMHNYIRENILREKFLRKFLVNKFTRQIMNNLFIFREYFLIRSDNGN